MIDTLLAAIIVEVDHRDPNPGRSLPNRWHDSGVVKVWTHVPTWMRDFALCVRRHESATAGLYQARNASGAAGAYQMMPALWHGTARWTPLARPWAHTSADRAPAYAQDAALIHVLQRGGASAWNGTHCGHGAS
jgi:hypothetical protein